MRKKILLFVLFISIVLSMSSQEVSLRVVEKKGSIDIRVRDEKWKKISLNDIIQYGTEIFTGFHSQLTIEVGKGSYITINQLSEVTIEKVIIRKDEATTNIVLNRGYVVILSKTMGEYKNRIFVSLAQGTVEFENSGGEIYLRQDKGAVVSSSLGKISIGSRFSKVYSIGKGEVCGMLPNGELIENDFFLRRKINVKSNDINESHQILAYYDLLFQHYTSDVGTNDYRDNFRP